MNNFIHRLRNGNVCNKYEFRRQNYLFWIKKILNKIIARVAKIAKMINNSCPNCCSCCFHCDNSLFNSLVGTSDNSSVDNRINNIVKGYKSSSNDRINSLSNIDILGNRKIVNKYIEFIFFLIGGREPSINKNN
ncbi:hypothetical protein BCR32DRAFT_283281 [Anaeromyces robustus]|uniref:Uncharacterized protein n=1 Tax=Anaeromyces robustus TaxID=1754192 RepID=A0A1Y1WW22_9FUNG|nr:hypothetical protein BCR32DRAFT_283281 [Anaeromyces robustus]|eukprot:ORX77324.1 hypothetical protein BCR32DRAFT_283281 [Anaeromyces robustus]